MPTFGDFGTGAINRDETYLGKGGIRQDIKDPRDFVFGRDVGKASPPFNWKNGYDVEKEITETLGKTFKLTVKDQDNSSSCGGMAWGYYGQALSSFFSGDISEKSAKFIYSQVFQGVGGSAGRDLCNLLIQQGWGLETDTSSYEKNKPPNEAFMQRSQDITEKARENAKKNKASAYANVVLNVETIAQAIRDNHGAVLGVTGVNNGTWLSERPTPPLTFSNSWNHWLYCGRVKEENGKKWFGVINSWGDQIGKAGWQWISEDYINFRYLGFPAIFSIWTIVRREDVVPPVVIPHTFTTTLRLGMKGQEVKFLQTKLNAILNGVVALKVDGDFGEKTKTAVMQFQSVQGLIQDGIVGQNTNFHLNRIP